MKTKTKVDLWNIPIHLQLTEVEDAQQKLFNAIRAYAWFLENPTNYNGRYSAEYMVKKMAIQYAKAIAKVKGR